MDQDTRQRILRRIPRDKAFYFFTSIGNYTGESATSLKEFIRKVAEVNVKSLEFHLYRGDFEKWIAEVLEDKYLAQEISTFRSLAFRNERLKDELHRVLFRIYSRLAGMP